MHVNDNIDYRAHSSALASMGPAVTDCPYEQLDRAVMMRGVEVASLSCHLSSLDLMMLILLKRFRKGGCW